MNKISIFICLCIFIAACSPKDSSGEHKNGGSLGQNVIKDSLKIITLKVDLENEKELQEEVDKGHQPWRLEPIDVAQIALQDFLHEDVDYEKCTLQSESKDEAIVVYEAAKLYKVKLKRLVNPQGIWTPIEIETK
jgi:hypothetical protein